MEKITYSIIIPVYNVENYIEECVESVLRQNTIYAFEIIIVNDGTKDASIEKCERFLFDSRVKIISQENSGPSVARNTGIKASNGEYLLFLDGDDVLGDNCLSTLDDYVKKDADVVSYSYYQYIDGQCNPFEYKYEYDCKLGKEFLSLIWEKQDNILPFPWAYLLKKDTVGDILFDEKLRNAEDYDFLMKVLPLAKTVYSINKPLYKYRFREGSITSQLSIKKAVNDVEIRAKYYNIYKNTALANYSVRALKVLLSVYCENADVNKKQIVEIVKANKKIIFKGKGNFVVKAIFALFGASIGVSIYKMAYSVVRRSK